MRIEQLNPVGPKQLPPFQLTYPFCLSRCSILPTCLAGGDHHKDTWLDDLPGFAWHITNLNEAECLHRCCKALWLPETAITGEIGKVCEHDVSYATGAGHIISVVNGGHTCVLRTCGVVHDRNVLGGFETGSSCQCFPLHWLQDNSIVDGVRIEDMGHKMGCNGVDNGKLWFDRESLTILSNPWTHCSLGAAFGPVVVAAASQTAISRPYFCGAPSSLCRDILMMSQPKCFIHGQSRPM